MGWLKPISFLLVATLWGLFSCNNAATPESKKEDKNDSMSATNNSASIREEAVTYSSNGATLKGYVTYDENKQGKRPIVLVVPEWWGLNDYPRMRAKQLARLGYLAMAVDIYGDGIIAADPTAAQTYATPFYKNPGEAKVRVDAALQKAKTFAQADTTQTAAIGYCFGGSVALNSARLGADLDGVVSFHGDLQGVSPKKGLKTKFLICHGKADQFVPQTQVDAFKKSMDSIGAEYTFKIYENATHAFTNPAATVTGKKFQMPIEYNAAADTASWNDMKAFFGKLFH